MAAIRRAGGLFLANMAVLVGSAVSGDKFLVWGWRIPFMLSIIMVGIGLYIRLGILETPIFRRIVAEERVERAPAIEVLKRQPKQVILAALARTAEQAPAYIYLAFVFAYGTQVLHQPRDFLLTALITAGLISFVTIPVAGRALRPLWPQAHLHHRDGPDRDFRLRLFRAAQHDGAGLDLSRHRPVVRPA